MALLDDLTLEVESHLSAFTARQERLTSLASPVAGTAAPTTIQVAESDALTRGIIQVDDELMAVTSFAAAVGDVPAWGRGHAGTTVASHSAGAKVTINPLFPRARIREAVKETVDALWPDLFGLGKVEITVAGTQQTYPLPAGVEQVLEVKYREVGTSGTWGKVGSWQFDATSNLTEYPTGRTLTIPAHRLPSSVKVEALVQQRPTITDSTASWDAMGLFPSARACVRYGALYRTVASVDFAHLGGQPVSAGYAGRSERLPRGQDLMKQYFALYQSELENERARMLAGFRPQMHFQG